MNESTYFYIIHQPRNQQSTSLQRSASDETLSGHIPPWFSSTSFSLLRVRVPPSQDCEHSLETHSLHIQSTLRK